MQPLHRSSHRKWPPPTGCYWPKPGPHRRAGCLWKHQALASDHSSGRGKVYATRARAITCAARSVPDGTTLGCRCPFDEDRRDTRATDSITDYLKAITDGPDEPMSAVNRVGLEANGRGRWCRQRLPASVVGSARCRKPVRVQDHESILVKAKQRSAIPFRIN